MKINVGEAAAALAIMGFAALMAVKGSTYPVGTISQMGPGYFPVMLGIGTILLGAATLVAVLRSEAPAPDVPWRASALVFLGVYAWGALAERFGLVPACIALLVLTSLARPPIRLRTMALTTVIVTVGAVLLFLGGFGLPLRAFRW